MIICTYTHTNIHTYIYIRVHICERMYIHVFTCTHHTNAFKYLGLNSE